MPTPNFPSLDGLADVTLRGGADMRPTLLHVLTNLYVQKLTHSPEEERHYTELALRLLESVDADTRAAIAAKLSKHLSPPSRVLQFLAADLAAAPTSDQEDRARSAANEAPPAARAVTSDPIGSNLAAELNELFFAASADERRLILLNLDIIAPAPAERPAIARDQTIGRRLEAAALARKHEEFARELGHALHISREQARRIANDESGEPFVVAAKALGIPRDALYRMLLFVNSSVGHSVERVHALADLYDAMSAQAAQDLVTVWQALTRTEDEGARSMHRSLLSDDDSARRPAAASERRPVLPAKSERRQAS